MQASGDIPVQEWMRAASTMAVFSALRAAGGTPRFVGGCIRDSLLGRPVKDIDIAVDQSPEDNLRLLAAAGIHTLPIGLDHGTVLAVVDRQHFEITTLRVDVETFGRQARVAFTDDWRADAERRDLTINALYADPDGTLYDPVGGRDDLMAGRVRFVGDPARRIEEDRLRILRFFRFHAWYGKGPADAGALAACTAAAAGLDDLSGERIRAELLRLLAAPDPAPCLELMAEVGVLARILPAGWAIDRLAGQEADPLRRLAALMLGDEEDARALAHRLHFSRKQRDRLGFLLAPPVDLTAVDDQELRRLLYRWGVERLDDLARLQGATALLPVIGKGAPPPFPLSGRDALDLGVEPGTRVGDLLAAVEAWWIDHDFAGGRKELLAELRRRCGPVEGD